MHTATTNGNGKSRLNGVHLQHITLPNSVALCELLEDPTLTAAPEALIPFLAWRQRLTLLAGREKKGGKTTYAATAAAKLSAGGTHLGQQLTPAKVLWTIAEGHVGDVARTMKDAGANGANVHIQYQLGDDRLTQLDANLAAWRPAVAFIDTLAAFTDDRITNAAGSDNWVSIMNTLTRLAQKYDCAIVIIAHTRKDDEEVRDSTAITGGVDVILRMTPARHNNARRIKAIGRWPIEDHTIRLDAASYTLHQDDEPASSSSHEHRVRAYLAANPTASKYATRKAVGGNSTATDAIYDEYASQVREWSGPRSGPKSRKYHA